MPTLLAPAKINVTLEVLSRREDGYHALRSVMVPLGLYDRIDLEPSAHPDFTSNDATIAADNLVTRALAAACPGSYAVRLHKAIPIGGGLGGGSSDAAAVLRAAMQGTLVARTGVDWLALARELGSDVPFFLAGTAALVEGTGERVTALGSLPPWWAVVVRPHASVPTVDAYRRLDTARAAAGEGVSRPRKDSASLCAVDALQRRDFAALAARLENDFHAIVLAAYPPVARAEAALSAAGARHVLVSGSGACLFALFEDEGSARAVATRTAPHHVAELYTIPFHHDAAWR